MIMFENLKSMNIDEFVGWYAENCIHDNDPCIKWFDETYCKNCDAVVKDGQEYAYCELNHKCRYFKDVDYIPDDKQIIKMWLESDCEDKEIIRCPLTSDDYNFEVGV